MKQSKNLTVSMHNFVKMSLVGISLVGATSVSAKEGDLQQELKVAAVSQKADIKNNQVIFFGPVTVTQGTININADELRAFSAETGGKKTMIATGNPATFSQELDDGRIGTASANEIKYELATSILTLKGNAKLDQAGSQVTGNLISYNIDKQQLIAESTGDGKDRVITIFQPENYPDLNDSTDNSEPPELESPKAEESEKLIENQATSISEEKTEANNAEITSTDITTTEETDTHKNSSESAMPVIEVPEANIETSIEGQQVKDKPNTDSLPEAPALEQTQ
ncbi:hypothetical protein TUM4249_04260 [Shewanella sp. KT0246]|nr:hypothetical protein TUM4249_04260 [Shewanella sp. KT0246]